MVSLLQWWWSFCSFSFLRNQWWCSFVETSWTKRISLESRTPSLSSTGAMRMARESSFHFPPVSVLSLSAFMFAVILCCIQRKLVSLIRLRSKARLLVWTMYGNLRSPLKKKCSPWITVCGLGVRACWCVCVCVGSSSCLFSALQCMTSPIRPCTLRAEDTKCTCQPRH